MSKQQHKLIRPLTGYFLGWGDDRPPHRYIKLATANGEQLVKVAKSLRPHIQDWQPGIWLILLGWERTCRTTGEKKIKAKQLLTSPQFNPPNNLPTRSSSPQTIDDSSLTSNLAAPIKIQICQGSSCRRAGSDKICQLMQTYLVDKTSPLEHRHDVTARVEIETVKCLHQCKAAPHAIVTSPAGARLPGKTHYRQIQPSQVPAILARHLPIASPSESIGTNLIKKIAAYLQQHPIATVTTP
jgi:(2Fe-2S) ferredoxin